ncbi:MAG: efflux RND transporter periplasmic adaptor subunit [Candidatus Omnitrophota bacterium]|jgi:multidrug efflux pump subunit AcrA (membrane-fusion protein)
MKRFFIILLLLSFSSLNLLLGCIKKESREITQEAIPVKVMRVKSRDIQETLDYVGNIKARDEAIIYPKVSGKIIQKVKDEGSFVEKQDVIAYIDRDEVGLKFEKAPVESSLAGVVGRVYVDIGEHVDQQTPVALVVNMDKVKIDLDIPEKYLPQVSLGQQASVSVDAYPQEEFSGEVTKISPVVDLTTRSAPIEISVDNSGHRLKSGMFANVRLILNERKNVPVILKEALIGKEPELFVYAVSDDKAILKKIILGIRQGPYFEVRSGLKDGDLVVIMGQQRLKDNTKVRVEIEEEKDRVYESS